MIRAAATDGAFTAPVPRDAASAQILNWGTADQPATDHRVVGATVDIPCMGGPLDGRGLLVPLDEEGVPPEVIHQTWLWIEYGGELLDTDVDGHVLLGTDRRPGTALDIRLDQGTREPAELIRPDTIPCERRNGPGDHLRCRHHRHRAPVVASRCFAAPLSGLVISGKLFSNLLRGSGTRNP